jgi:hypothetical protein
MAELLYQTFSPYAGLLTFLALVALSALCSFGFRKRDDALGHIALLDKHIGGYSPAEAHELMRRLQDRGRRIYALTAVTLDLVFPFAHGGALLIGFILLWGRTDLLLIPAILIVADLLENATSFYLCMSYKEEVISRAAYAGSWFTITKWSAVVLSYLLGISGLINLLFHKVF